MPAKCPNCGFDANRDQARFCRTCGGPLAPVARVQGPGALAPAQSGPIQPAQQPPSWIKLPSRLAPRAPTAPILAGVVATSGERRDRAPRDWNRVFFIGSLVLMASPAIIAGMVLLCIVPAVAIAISILLGLFRRPSGPAEVPIYELSVDDALSGRMVNVEMVGQRGGGRIDVGDDVEVYGKWVSPTAQDSVIAWEIRVTQRYSSSSGRKIPCGAVVKARRGFPAAVTVGTFILMLLVTVGTWIAISS